MIIGSMGIQQSTTYFVGQKKYDINEIYASTLAIWLFTSVVCVLACYALIYFFSSGRYSNQLILLSVAAIPFSLYTTYSSGIYLGTQNIKEFNRINWIPAVCTLGFTILFISVLSLGVMGAMLGIFFGAFLFSFFVVLRIRKIVLLKPMFNFTVIKSMMGLGVAYAISLLINNLNYRIDIIILEKLSTPYELGIYVKGANVVQYLWQIPLLVSTLIFSRSASAKDGKEFSIKVCRLLRFAGVLMIMVSIGLFFISDYFINFLYGKAFAESAMSLKILIPGVLVFTIYVVLGMDAQGKGKPWISMKAMVPALVINVVINLLCIPRYGARGAAFASTISYSFAAIAFLWIYAKMVDIPIGRILKFDKADGIFLLTAYQKVKTRVFRK